MRDWWEWWEDGRDRRFRLVTLFFERVYAPLMLLFLAVVAVCGLVALAWLVGIV